MRAILVAATIIPLMMISGIAHTQSTAQFWVLTDRGNVFLVEGPPPYRPPGFDTASRLSTIPADDSVLSLHGAEVAVAVMAGEGGGDAAFTFGEAAPINPLPPYDPERKTMTASIIYGGWDNNHPLYAQFLVGDLQNHHTQPYMGPARYDPSTENLLFWCNGTHGNVTCIDNTRGRIINSSHSGTVRVDYLLELQQGRTIIYGGQAGKHYEVMITCPTCYDTVQAFHGTGGIMGERGFIYNMSGPHHAPVLPAIPPLSHFDPGLVGLSWHTITVGGVPDETLNHIEVNGIKYWAKCPNPHYRNSLTYDSNINQLTIICEDGSPPRLESGATLAHQYQPLYPGWNHITMQTNHDFIVVDMPMLEGGLIQIREGGAGGCCVGFREELRNMSGETAVIVTDTRHLAVIPPGGVVPLDFPTLREDHKIKWEGRHQPRHETRWIGHESREGDFWNYYGYNGLLYGPQGRWPPYEVIWAEAKHVDFVAPPIIDDILLLGATKEMMDHLVQVKPETPHLLDSEIYDIRNDKLLRSDVGRFKLWDNTYVERPYIQPWMNLQKNPAWEVYGIPLQANTLQIIDLYHTIPIIKPTRLTDTYMSSLPCGYPETHEIRNKLIGAVYDSVVSGQHDPHLVEFWMNVAWNGTITQNTVLQQVHLASRTYLDYIDGYYLAGDTIHIPILAGRPYICTTIAPNILESEFRVGYTPRDADEHSPDLSGDRFVVDVAGGLKELENRNATHLVKTGLQSPRSGTISLDVSMEFGAEAGAWGGGENFTAVNFTKPWVNGTINVTAFLLVSSHNITMGSFQINVTDIHKNNKFIVDDNKCYGRFSTTPTTSEYVSKTISLDAKEGEHVPIMIELVARADPGQIEWEEVCHRTTLDSATIHFLLDTFRVRVG